MMQMGEFKPCFHLNAHSQIVISIYSASHSRVAPENGLQKEQKCKIFACHTCNDVRLCVLGIRKKKLATRKDKIR
jgi:hypothetical protein